MTGFERSESGTDVYVMGFKFSKQTWQRELIVAVLDGFFFAIKENNLIVTIGDKEVSSQTLPDLLEEYKEYIDEKTYDYYQVLIDPDTTFRTFSYFEKSSRYRAVVTPLPLAFGSTTRVDM